MRYGRRFRPLPIVFLIVGFMPLPIRLVGALLRRKPNLSPQSLIKRLQTDDSYRINLLESTLAAAVQLNTQGTKHTKSRK